MIASHELSFCLVNLQASVCHSLFCTSWRFMIFFSLLLLWLWLRWMLSFLIIYVFKVVVDVISINLLGCSCTLYSPLLLQYNWGAGIFAFSLNKYEAPPWSRNCNCLRFMQSLNHWFVLLLSIAIIARF